MARHFTEEYAARVRAELERDVAAAAQSAADARREHLRRTARRLVHRERSKLALAVPVAWLGVLHGAAWLAWTLACPAWLRALLVLAGGTAVLGRAERRSRRLPWARTIGAGAWMLAAGTFGPSGPLGLAWWVTGLAASVPYWMNWWRRRGARRTTRALDPPSDAPPLSAQAQLWQDRVVPHHAAYKLTRLETVRAVPDGYSGIIVGQPGPTRFSQMALEAAVETIASANRVHPSQVAVEDPGDGDASRARLTVIRSDRNLTETVWLEDSRAAIDPATGTAQIGRYFDLAPAHRQFWTTSGGAEMGVVAGDTGSGKSALVSTLISLAHECPLVATALLDPQSGSSQPDWSGRTHIYGEGHEATYEHLRMLDFVMVRRADYVAHAPWADGQGRERSGKPFLLPGDRDLGGMTMLFVVVEELKFFLDGPFGNVGFDLLATAVRTWRKAGGSLLVANQNLGLDNFKNNQSFRSNLISAGSLTALRTGSSTDHGMVGLPADPSKLPQFFRDGAKTRGLGYTTGIDRRPSATFRAMPVRDAFGIASTPSAGKLGALTLGWIDEWHHQQRRDRTPAVPAQDAPTHTSGDVQAAVEQALRDTRRPLEVGAICVAVQRNLPGLLLAEVPAALRALKHADVVQQRGDLYHLLPH